MSESELIGVLGTLFLLILPFIVMTLTQHQRKMAEIMHARRHPDREEAILHEIRQLKDLVAQQALAIDALQDRVSRPGADEDTIRHRIG